MKYGLIYANTGEYAQPDQLLRLAHMAEDVGADSLWVVDHIVYPAGFDSSDYPYHGPLPTGRKARLSPLLSLAFVAARTATLRLATGVLIVPARNPIELAQEVATLDVLSQGRVTLGLGVGWMREEFAALGIPFEERGARADEAIEVMRRLWQDDPAEYEGRWTAFGPVHLRPRPVQAGGPPIVIGGSSKPAAERAGRIGDGFFPAPHDGSAQAVARLVQMAREAAEEHGRDPDRIEVTARCSTLEPAEIEAFAAAGVHRLLLPALGRSVEELRTDLAEAVGATG